MSHFLEIRSYRLKPGSGDEFDREALPLLQRWKIDVVAYGPSLHDKDSYYLMRRYDSLAHREDSEDTFYGSVETGTTRSDPGSNRELQRNCT